MTLICISLMINFVEYFFHVSVDHLYVFFGTMSIQVLCQFLIVFFNVNLSEYFYILNINLLKNIPFANFFSSSLGSLYILLMVYFAAQKVLVWCVLICLFLLLFPLPEEIHTKIILLRPISKKEYYLCFLLEILWFRILHLSL